MQGNIRDKKRLKRDKLTIQTTKEMQMNTKTHKMKTRMTTKRGKMFVVKRDDKRNEKQSQRDKN